VASAFKLTSLPRRIQAAVVPDLRRRPCRGHALRPGPTQAKAAPVAVAAVCVAKNGRAVLAGRGACHRRPRLAAISSSLTILCDSERRGALKACSVTRSSQRTKRASRRRQSQTMSAGSEGRAGEGVMTTPPHAAPGRRLPRARRSRCGRRQRNGVRHLTRRDRPRPRVTPQAPHAERPGRSGAA
jgi:hypothetical protein